jgi:hypothetical protein
MPFLLRACSASALLVALALAPAPHATAAVAHLVLEPESVLVFPGEEPISLEGWLTIRFAAWPLAGPTALEVIDLAIGAGLLAATLDRELDAPGLGIAFADGTFLVPTLFLALHDDVPGGEPMLLAIPDLAGTLAEDGSSGLLLETVFELEVSAGIASVQIVAVPQPGGEAFAATAVAALAALRAQSSRRASGTRLQRFGSGWPSRSRKISRKR